MKYSGYFILVSEITLGAGDTKTPLKAQICYFLDTYHNEYVRTQ